MVKKIQGPTTPSIKTTDAITSSQAIQTTKIGGAQRISSTTAQQGTRRISSPNRQITPADREHLFQLITEEVDKMVEENIIPKKKKDTISTAVKMVIDASIKEDE